MTAASLYAAIVWWIGCHLSRSWRVEFILGARALRLWIRRI
jgi:hypothetical protein